MRVEARHLATQYHAHPAGVQHRILRTRASCSGCELWQRVCVSRHRYRGIARRDAQPVSSSVNNHTSTSRAAARKAMIAAHLGLTLGLPPHLLSLCNKACTVLPLPCSISSPHRLAPVAFSLASAVDNTGCSVRACRQPLPPSPPTTAYARVARLRCTISFFCALAIYAERGLLT